MSGPSTRPTVVVFDIDGTLLESSSLHHDLIAVVLARDGLDVFFQPWASYPHYTDRGVIDELLKHFRQRPAEVSDLELYDEAYRAALAEHLESNALGEISGAARLLRELSAMPNVHLCYATGSLRKMAEIKLGLVGVDAKLAALATGSDFNSREEIVLDAIRRASGPLTGIFDVVILGDGIWDQRTAENLAIPFVAVQSGAHAFGAGPVLILNNFDGLAAAALIDLARPFEPEIAAQFLSERSSQ
jgi:phosphoglycolate phosphatase-like HAD superfamily hydrolase